jgi:hypothetical protein
LYTDAFQYFLDLRQETYAIRHKNVVHMRVPEYARTDMEDGSGKFNVPEVARALRHALAAGLTLEVSVYCPQTGIHQTTSLRPLVILVHNLRELNLGDRVRFLLTGDISESDESEECAD